MYLYNKFRILVVVVSLCSICAFTPSVINQHSPSLDYRGSLAEPSKFTSYEKQAARNIQLNAVSPTANLALISSSIAILSGYHINLFNKERNSSTKTWRQVSRASFLCSYLFILVYINFTHAFLTVPSRYTRRLV